MVEHQPHTYVLKGHRIELPPGSAGIYNFYTDPEYRQSDYYPNALSKLFRPPRAYRARPEFTFLFLPNFPFRAGGLNGWGLSTRPPTSMTASFGVPISGKRRAPVSNGRI